VKKISQGRVVSLKIEKPVGVTFFNGSLFTVSYATHCIYRGENFELLAGSGEKGHKDGLALRASFNNPYTLVGSNGSLYVADSGNQCIRRVLLFVEWSPSTHHQAPKETRDAVRTLMLMRRKRDTLWNGVPKEILFLICAQLHRLF
jgi:hypothetical protein